MRSEANNPQQDTSQPVPPVRRRNGRRRLLIVVLLVGVIAAADWYLNSASFEARVRERVIAELERATGGRVDLPSFSWSIARLEFIAQDLTIHGTEPPGEAPYLHVDYLKVRIKVLSLLGRSVGLRSVEAQHPVAHITVRAGGETNQPSPLVKQESPKPASLFARIFDLQTDRLDINNGLLWWNDSRVPMDIHADDFTANMVYAAAQKQYEGSLKVGHSAVTLAGERRLASSAELKFAIARQSMEVRSLKWASAGSNLQASGRIVDFSDPRLELAYDASVNMAELGSFTQIQGMRGGELNIHASGKFWWDKTLACDSTGTLRVKNFTWQVPGVNLPGVNATARFAIDDTKIVIDHIDGRMLAGSATGKVEVKDWTRHTKHPAANALVETGHGEFQVRGIKEEGVAEVFSSRKLPVAKLNLRGVVDGKVRVAWRGTLDLADANVDLNLTSTPTTSAPPGLQVSGHVAGIYRMASGEMDFADLRLATASTRINARGVLGSDSRQLTLQAQTENLHEWDPILSALGGSADLPLKFQGKAAFTGSIGGRFRQPVVRGHVTLTAFDSLVRIPALSNRTVPISWDSLSADVQYAPRFFAVSNGRADRGPAQVIFSGRTTLLNGQFDKTSGFQAQLEIHHAEVSDVQSLTRTGYPVTGIVDLVATASGTPAYVRGNGSFQLTSGTLYNEPFRTLKSGVRFTSERVELLNAVFLQNGAQVTGSGWYRFADQSFEFGALGEHINLSHIKSLQRPRLDLAGNAQFHAKGSGTVKEPAIEGTLGLTQLSANGETIGNILVTGVTQGRALQLTTQSQLKNALLEASGSIALAGDFPGRIMAHFDKLDFDPLLRAYLGDRVTGHSSANGTLEITGAFLHPSELSITGTVQQLSAEIEKIQLRNEGPVVFAYKNGSLDLKSSHITGENTDLKAEGTLALNTGQQLDLHANGRANLKLFQGLSPGLTSSGTAGMQLHITGTPLVPTLNGEVQIEHAAFALEDLPNGLSEVNGSAVFNENRLQIRALTAKTGGGDVDISGFVTYRRALFFDLTAKGKGIRLRYPPGVSSAADADLHAAGTLQNALLSGTVMVTRFGVNPEFDFATYLERAKQVPTTMAGPSVLDNMRLDVHVTSAPQLEVQTALAKITGDVDIRLRGTVARPAVLGRVNILEGDVFFSSTKYHLERGDITFHNPVRIEPILNIEATARVQEYDITLGFHGSVDKLSTTYRSEPPLPSTDIVALLALGRTREDTALSQPTIETFNDTTSNAILGQALTAAIGSRAQKLFGVSRIKIDPQVGGLENNPNARLTIEQQVNNNITLTYITNLSSSAQQVIQAEYAVNKSLSIVLIRDVNGVLGFEVRVRQRKK